MSAADQRRAAEAVAQDIALHAPAAVIEGWRAGIDASGDADGVKVFDRALEIQRGWHCIPAVVTRTAYDGLS